MEVRLLTIQEAATYLHVSIKTVRRFIECGKLKASKIGAQWRIHPKDLKEMFEQKSPQVEE